LGLCGRGFGEKLGVPRWTDVSECKPRLCRDRPPVATPPGGRNDAGSARLVRPGGPSGGQRRRDRPGRPAKGYAAHGGGAAGPSRRRRRGPDDLTCAFRWRRGGRPAGESEVPSAWAAVPAVVARPPWPPPVIRWRRSSPSTGTNHFRQPAFSQRLKRAEGHAGPETACCGDKRRRQTSGRCARPSPTDPAHAHLARTAKHQTRRSNPNEKLTAGSSWSSFQPSAATATNPGRPCASRPGAFNRLHHRRPRAKPCYHKEAPRRRRQDHPRQHREMGGARTSPTLVPRPPSPRGRLAGPLRVRPRLAGFLYQPRPRTAGPWRPMGRRPSWPRTTTIKAMVKALPSLRPEFSDGPGPHHQNRRPSTSAATLRLPPPRPPPPTRPTASGPAPAERLRRDRHGLQRHEPGALRAAPTWRGGRAGAALGQHTAATLARYNFFGPHREAGHRRRRAHRARLPPGGQPP